MGLGRIASGAVRYAYGSVKNLDSFSSPIAFTYKGENTFKTFIGGTVSMVILTIMTIYGYSLAQVMWYRKDTNKSKSTKIVDLANSTEIHYPGKSQNYYFYRE